MRSGHVTLQASHAFCCHGSDRVRDSATTAMARPKKTLSYSPVDHSDWRRRRTFSARWDGGEQ